LRNHLLQAQQNYQQWATLLKERDVLEQSVADVEKRIASAQFSWHQQQQQQDTLLPAISHEQEVLSSLKRQRQLIDNRLDKLESTSEDAIADLTAQLISAILHQYPEQADIYMDIQSEVDMASLSLQELESAHENCVQLSGLLQSMQEMRQNIKRKGIFSYIIGPNPNATIARHMQAIIALIDKQLPSLRHNASLGHHAEWHQLFEGQLKYFEELKLQCSQRWGFKHLDTTFKKAQKHVQDYEAALHHAIHKGQRIYENKLGALQSWLKNAPES